MLSQNPDLQQALICYLLPYEPLISAAVCIVEWLIIAIIAYGTVSAYGTLFALSEDDENRYWAERSSPLPLVVLVLTVFLLLGYGIDSIYHGKEKQDHIANCVKDGEISPHSQAQRVR